MIRRLAPTYRLADLVNSLQLDQYLGRSPVPCAISDHEGQWISAPPQAHDVCSVLSDNKSVCQGCLSARLSGAYQSAGAHLHVCPVGTHAHVSAIRIVDEVVGYVCGPLFRLEEYRPEQLQAARTSGKQSLLPRVATPVEAAAFSEEVNKLAAQLSRRCTSERGLRILTDGARAIARATSEEKVKETLTESLDLLFRGASTSLYLVEDDGPHLRSLRTPVGTASSSDSKEDNARLVSRALATGEIVVESGEAASRLAIPLIAGNHQAIGAIAIHADSSRSFGQTETQTAEVLGNTAAVAVIRFRGEPAATIHSQLTQPASTWMDKVLDLMTRPIETSVQRSQARYELFQGLVNYALEACDAVRGSVRLFSSLSGELRIAYTSGDGWTEHTKGVVHRKGDKSAGNRAVELRRPFLIDDVKQESTYYKKVFPDAVSNFALPIFLRNEVVALLTLQSREPGTVTFTPERRYYIRTMVRQAGEVLERLADIQARWLSELDVATQSPVEADVCRAAVRNVRKILGAHGCSIFMLSRTSSALEVVASTAPLPSFPVTYSVGEGGTGWVAKTRTTLRLDDIRDATERRGIAKDLAWSQKEWGEVDAGQVAERLGFLAAPLVSGETLLGVIRVSLKEGGENFDITDELVIDRIARLLSRKISAIRATEQSTRHIGELASLVRLDTRLAATLDVESVCSIVLEHVSHITGCVAAQIRFIEGNPAHLKLAYAYGPFARDIREILQIGEGVAGEVARSGVPRFATDIQQDRIWLEMITEVAGRYNTVAWAGSGACFPLIGKGQIIGTLLLEWSGIREFDSAYQAHLYELASRCADAVRAALLYREKVTRLGKIRAVGLRLTQVSTSQTIGDLLNQILDFAFEDADIATAAILLWNDTHRSWELRRDKTRDIDKTRQADAMFARSNPHLEEAMKSAQVHVVAGDDQFPPLTMLPLRVRGHCIGFILLTSLTPGQIDGSRIEFLETFAAFAAVAIENATLLEKERNEAPLAIIGAMATGFLHDLNNPLQVLQLTSDRMTDHLQSHDELRKLAGQIPPQIKTITRVCKSIRHFGDRATAFVNLQEVLSRVMSDNEPKATRSQISLQPRFSSPNVSVRANVHQVETMVSLVILNAIEWSHPGQSVTVSIDEGESEVVVRIVDTGKGMDANTLEHCRDMNFSKNPSQDGARGRGLFVVDFLARRNQMRLDIESTLGEGTTVELGFPREEAGDAESTNR